MKRQWHPCLAAGIAAILGAVPATMVAQGYSVNEHSACATGRAGTGVAAPCADGSAIVYNPAGLSSLGKGKTVIAAGGTFIAPSGGFTNDATRLKSDLDSKVYPVPTVYLAHGISDQLAVGVGLFAPYGLTTDWPSTSEARFLGYKSLIRNIYVQPTVAWKFNKYFQLGAGLDVNFGHVQLKQHLDLSQQQVPGQPFTFQTIGITPGTDFADANLTGNGTSVGGHFGLIITPDKHISFGVRYLTKQTVKYKNGAVDFTQINTGILLPAGNPLLIALGLPAGTPLDAILAGDFAKDSALGDQGATTQLTNPEQWTFGAAVNPTDKLTLMFDVTLQQWSVFKDIVFNFANAATPDLTLPEDNKNTTSFRFGAQYAVSPTVDLRIGYINHNAASPDDNVTVNLPEGKRAEFTGGVGFMVGKGLRIDGAYQYINQADRRGRTLAADQFPNGVSKTNGLFNFHAHLFSASVSYQF